MLFVFFVSVNRFVHAKHLRAKVASHLFQHIGGIEMAKVRQPDTVAAAVNLIAATIGHDACAAAIGKTEGLIYAFADPDKEGRPSVEQAMMLDAAYMVATGETIPPVMTVYQQMLKERVGQLTHQAMHPRDRFVALCTELGQLGAELTASLSDGAITPRERAKVHSEADDVIKIARKIKRDVDAMAGRK